MILTSPIVRLRVHLSRRCAFNQLSDWSINTLFVLIHVKEETLRVIFQPSFSRLDTQGSSYRVIRTAKMGCTGSKVTVCCNFRALNKLFGPFKLIISKRYSHITWPSRTTIWPYKLYLVLKFRKNYLLSAYVGIADIMVSPRSQFGGLD